MSFTYTGDLSDPVQYVRFRITDTTEEVANYMDEEIQYFIDQHPSPQTQRQLDKVSYQLLQNWIMKLLASPSRERAGQYEQYFASADALKVLADQIADQIASGNTPSVRAGGINHAEVCAERRNRSTTDFTWHKDMFFDNECGGCSRGFDDDLIR